MILLETSRLRLRRFAPDDADLLVDLDSDPEVMRYITGGRPTSREAYVDTYLPWWFEIYQQQPLLGFWVAERLPDGEFLGWFHLRDDEIEPQYLELGYRLRMMEKCGLRRTGEFVYPDSLGIGETEAQRRGCKYEIDRAQWLASRA